MPKLSTIDIIGHALFMSKAFKLPTKADYKPPPDMAHYQDSMSLSDHIPPPPKHLAPGPWFTPQSPPNKYYQKSCDDIGKKWQDFHDKMLKAVCFAHDMWRLQAKFSGLKIMGPCAIGKPGCLKGPKLDIKNAPMVATWSGPNDKKLRDAVHKGVSECFKKWQDKVMVPGLPWYPAFAAFPGPQAPPMPNVPTPLIACPSAMVAEITVPKKLYDAMLKNVPKSIKDEDHDKHYEAALNSIANVLAVAFLIWLASQQVMLVMGRGPIPTFAPPYVPVGPVVNGSNLPGVHLIS